MALISIRIPCYNQPELLDDCLKSISGQTFTEFEILIFDDFSVSDYSKVLAEYHHLNIKYIRNSQNLGAIGNMMNALYYPCNTKYLIVFHEDDLMHPFFLEYNLQVFNTNSELVWVGSEMEFFSDHNAIEQDFFNAVKYKTYIESKSLVFDLLAGTPLCFGSIIYQKELLKKAVFDIEKYGILGDRPLLLELAREKSCAIINLPLIKYRLHLDEDNRSKDLKENQLLNFYYYYKNFFDNKLDKNDKKIISSQMTIQLINSFKQLKRENKSNILIFLLMAFKLELISVKYLFLRVRIIRRTIEKIKK
jgi:glycosyltransferase involved in cell wall biosynthesis